MKQLEDYVDSYGSDYYEGFSHGWDSCDYENEFGYSDENHYDPFFEGYLLGIQEMESGNGVSKPNVVIGLQCSTADDEKDFVKIRDKVALTIPEAAAYSNIGQNRIEKLLKTPNCPFALFVGAKKLVKRSEFDKFISQTLEL